MTVDQRKIEKSNVPLKVSLADFFDTAGRLRPLQELPPELAAAVASFDVRRIIVRLTGETTTTEELVRVKLRDGRRAEVSRQGTTLSARFLRQKSLQPCLVQTRERSIGTGQTSAASSMRREG